MTSEDGNHVNRNRNRQKTLEFRTSEINFPTDNISIANLKALEPSDFDWRFERNKTNDFYDRHVFDDLLFSALRYERRFAVFTYCEKKGIDPTPITRYGPCEREELVSYVDDAYQEIGISDSTEQSLRMMRDITLQVEKQLDSSLGRG